MAVSVPDQPLWERILDFEDRTAHLSLGRKRGWIWAEFRLSTARYYSELDRALQLAEALERFPDLVARLLRARSERREKRTVLPMDPPAGPSVPEAQSAFELGAVADGPEQARDRGASAPESVAPDPGITSGTARDLGAQRAAGAVDPAWRARADAAVSRLAAAGKEFTAEDVREIAGDPASHPNAMGSVFLSASRKGLITRVGYRPSERRSLNRHPIAVWVGATS